MSKELNQKTGARIQKPNAASLTAAGYVNVDAEAKTRAEEKWKEEQRKKREDDERRSFEASKKREDESRLKDRGRKKKEATETKRK